jgi:hypothetical protein
MTATGPASFENVRNQIGFCGIWCGSCVVGNGALRELTRRYEGVTAAYGLQKWAPEDFDYLEFSKGLRSIEGIPLCPGCLKGGGREGCEIRACATSRQLRDCTECAEFGQCEHSKIVEKMRSGSRAAGLFVKEPHAENEELIQRWSAELKGRWPCCVLFMDGHETRAADAPSAPRHTSPDTTP